MNKRPKSPTIIGSRARVGAFIGACIPFLYFGPDLVRRLLHAAHGGRGESAMWGEPLFYIVVLALPLSAIGYFVGRALDARRDCGDRQDSS